MRSWRTTLSGILAIATVASKWIIAATSGNIHLDPASISADAGTLIAGIGLIKAGDDKALDKNNIR